jgi:hypothetical protein
MNEDIVGTIAVEGGIKCPGKLFLLAVTVEELPWPVVIAEYIRVGEHQLLISIKWYKKRCDISGKVRCGRQMALRNAP